MLAQSTFHEAFTAWYTEAVATEPRVPDAMQVATVDAQGRPTLRTVLMKDHDAEGFTFYTNLGSRKATQLTQNAALSACFHWKSLERQVIIDGTVTAVDDAVADAYFASRPRGSQIGAWASRQSAALDSRATLHQAMADATARFGDGPVPRPPFWSGYRIAPQRVEFWQGREDRLHERTVFTRTATGWTTGLCYP